MTIADLANELNTTVAEVFEHYKKISVEIPPDENYVLSTDLIKSAIPNYEYDFQRSFQNSLIAEDKITSNPKITYIENASVEPISTENIYMEFQSPTAASTEPFINKELKIDNLQPEKLIGPKILGRILLPTENDKNSTKVEGNKRNDYLDKSIGLENRKEKLRGYKIEALSKLETYFERNDSALLKELKNHNAIPDLLFEGEYWKVQNKTYGFFKKVFHHNGITISYPILNYEVTEIFIATGELTNGKKYQFEATLAIMYERKGKGNPFLLQAKNENIQEIIELSAVNKELTVKQLKLKEINNYLINAEHNLEFLNKTVEATNNHLQKMENLLSTLKDRVSLCRNLQFISEDDENKYLNLLSAKELKPENHYDFEKDFDKNFSKLSEHIHAYLYHKKNLIYTRYQIKNFLTLLRTHDIIVLSGLSGSGKTQIVKAFAEALGGVAKIIPVKPNWTSSDDLIGYYNPLQMSFLPTPFTEAIVEAIGNPNQLYFICLDEMNLARAEYYFADFLSKLEERSKQPEIELYANHEEELFVSEFSTLLNLIESSINGKKIKSWQEFLDNEESRKKFFEMLGNTDKESMLQLHSKMKRRLMDILKFPSTIRIPDNIHFIGAINVDETTHYFSPKILDRIHVVKFDNPLLFEEQVNRLFENTETKKELKPVYTHPNLFSERKELPAVNNAELSVITQKLKEINLKFLLPLNIDFGIRSIRQSLNYALLNKSTYDYGDVFDISLNTVILQKIFPRFIFDGNVTAKNGETKIKVVKELQKFLADEFNEFYYNYESDETDMGKSSSEYLEEMIKQSNINNSQFNFFA